MVIPAGAPATRKSYEFDPPGQDVPAHERLEQPQPRTPARAGRRTRLTRREYKRSPEALAFATGASAGFLAGQLVAVIMFLVMWGLR